jgi:hypothetical protein
MEKYPGWPDGQMVAIFHLKVLAWAFAILGTDKTAPVPKAAAPAVFKNSRRVFFMARLLSFRFICEQGLAKSSSIRQENTMRVFQENPSA